MMFSGDASVNGVDPIVKAVVPVFAVVPIFAVVRAFAADKLGTQALAKVINIIEFSRAHP
jgi:hypothetical protein